MMAQSTPMAHLICECKRCGHEDERGAFYRERPGCVPSFTDACPVCHSENVDVVNAPVAAAASKPPGTSNWKGNKAA